MSFIDTVFRGIDRGQPGMAPIRYGRVSRVINVAGQKVRYVVVDGGDAYEMPMLKTGIQPKVGDWVAFVAHGNSPLGLGLVETLEDLQQTSSGLFRSHANQRPQGPQGTLEALGYTGPKPITRNDIDGILNAWVASTGGATRLVTDTTSWATACSAAQPGDLIRLTASTGSPLDFRYSKYSLGGATLSTSGLPGLPIVATCANGVFNNVSVNNNFEGNIDVMNADHLWVVGWNGIGSTFGVRCMNLDGTATHPFRVAWCDLRQTGDASIVAQGWFQLIATSGGTPPSGSGNEWGYSSYGVIEENTVDQPGRRNASTGEGIYLGYGSAPGWISRAHHVWSRYNRVKRCTSDYVDIKPGCHQIYVHDNELSLGAFVAGAAIQTLYVSADLSARPAWYNFDPEIWIWGNRTWDGNISNPQGSSSEYFVQSSLAGVRMGYNLGFGFANGGIGHHLRSERAASESQVAGEKWWTFNNLFWMGDGVLNGGAPAASPVAFNSTWVDSRNNVGLPATVGAQFAATADDYAGLASIPAVSSVNPLPDLGVGIGSAYYLAAASDLIRAGASIADLSLYFTEDIFGRTIDTAAPSAGPFEFVS